jgi:hypothetical protein
MPLAQVVGPAVTGGVNAVLFEEQDLPPGPRAAVARFVHDSLAGRATFLIDACSGVRGSRQAADAIHGEDPDRLGRRLAFPMDPGNLLLPSPEGPACLLAELNWADPASAMGRLQTIVSGTDLPVVAGIGVPLDQVRGCLAAGAAGIGLSAELLSAQKPLEAAAAYLLALLS